MKAKRIDFLGLPLDAGLTLDGICGLLDKKGQARLVAYISPSSWAVAKRHPDYLEAMKQMTVIRAGGEGVARACNWLTGLPCPRINFDMTSMADPFFRKAATDGATLMFVGGQPSVDENFAEKVKTNYPQIKIVGSQHGYGELPAKAAVILEKNPDAVIIGMGSPRQELFLLDLQKAGYKGMAITCGGFFDQYLEEDDYYPDWVNKMNLRFAWRLLKEPHRLWRRYLIDYQLFIWEALKAFWKKYFPQAEAFAKDNLAKVKKKADETAAKFRRD